MTKRMVIMLVVVGLLFGGIFGYKAFMGAIIKKYKSGNKAPPAIVTTMKAEMQSWQPQLSAVGSLRAHRGVDVTTEIAGLVRKVNFVSGHNVRAGDLLVELNADSDIAQMHAFQAAADLAKIV